MHFMFLSVISDLPVTPTLERIHTSHTVVQDPENGGSFWNLVAIMITSLDIGNGICTSGLWRPFFLYLAPRRLNVSDLSRRVAGLRK